jgi:hypothetical protein
MHLKQRLILFMHKVEKLFAILVPVHMRTGDQMKLILQHQLKGTIMGGQVKNG